MTGFDEYDNRIDNNLTSNLKRIKKKKKNSTKLRRGKQQSIAAIISVGITAFKRIQSHSPRVIRHSKRFRAMCRCFYESNEKCLTKGWLFSQWPPYFILRDDSSTVNWIKHKDTDFMAAWTRDFGAVRTTSCQSFVTQALIPFTYYLSYNIFVPCFLLLCCSFFPSLLELFSLFFFFFYFFSEIFFIPVTSFRYKGYSKKMICV